MENTLRTRTALRTARCSHCGRNLTPRHKLNENNKYGISCTVQTELIQLRCTALERGEIKGKKTHLLHCKAGDLITIPILCFTKLLSIISVPTLDRGEGRLMCHWSYFFFSPTVSLHSPKAVSYIYHKRKQCIMSLSIRDGFICRSWGVPTFFHSGLIRWATVDIWVILDRFIFKHKNNLAVEQCYDCCPFALFY